MNTGSLCLLAKDLPGVWKSRLLGKVGNSNIKLIRMGGDGIPEEYHTGFDELLVVIEGEMTLVIDGLPFNLKAGDFYLIPSGVKHEVIKGSYGTLLLVDAEL